jgi:hypothetical protein
MTWATPPTFASGNVLTAAQLNVLTNDLLATMPANALHGTADIDFAGANTFAPGVFAATGANVITEMRAGQQSVLVTETTTSSAFTDLASIGPQVTVDCNTLAVVFMNVAISLDTTATGATGFHVDGATTIAVANNGPSMTGMAAGTHLTLMNARTVTVNAGSNTFTMQYVVSAGTTGTFWRRHMTVWPF